MAVSQQLAERFGVNAAHARLRAAEGSWNDRRAQAQLQHRVERLAWQPKEAEKARGLDVSLGRAIRNAAIQQMHRLNELREAEKAPHPPSARPSSTACPPTWSEAKTWSGGRLENRRRQIEAAVVVQQPELFSPARVIMRKAMQMDGAATNAAK